MFLRTWKHGGSGANQRQVSCTRHFTLRAVNVILVLLFVDIQSPVLQYAHSARAARITPNNAPKSSKLPVPDVAPSPPKSKQASPRNQR
jgi:hypothetical protein